MAQARIRPETQGAESVLHDMGVLSIFGSDSMAMGNIGETIITTWQLASVMKEKRGRLKEEQGDNDNFQGQTVCLKIYDKSRHYTWHFSCGWIN